MRSLREIFHFALSTRASHLRKCRRLKRNSPELAGAVAQNLIGPPILSSQIVLYARRSWLSGLKLMADYPELFRVIYKINAKFMPIVTRYAITEQTMVNSEDTLFDDPLALAMLIDIFSERGYQALVDVNHRSAQVDRPETHEITCDQKRIYRFQVMFAASATRRGNIKRSLADRLSAA